MRRDTVEVSIDRYPNTCNGRAMFLFKYGHGRDWPIEFYSRVVQCDGGCGAFDLGIYSGYEMQVFI